MSGLRLVKVEAGSVDMLKQRNAELERQIAEANEKVHKQHELILLKGKILEKKDQLIDTMMKDDIEKTKIREQESAALYQALHAMTEQLHSGQSEEKTLVFTLEADLAKARLTVEERDMQIQQKVVQLEQKNTEIAKLREHSAQSTTQQIDAQQKIVEAHQARELVEQEAARKVADMQSTLEAHKRSAEATAAAKVAALESTLQKHRAQIEDIGKSATTQCESLERQLREKEIETKEHKKQVICGNLW